MENNSYILERVNNLKEIILRVEWLGLSNQVNAITAENIDFSEFSFISYALNVDIEEIYASFFPHQDLPSLFNKILHYLYHNTLNSSNIYPTLLNDSVIPSSPFLNSYLSSNDNTSDLISSLIFSEIPYKIHQVTQQYNLFSNTQHRLKLQVTNEKPSVQDPNLTYTLVKNDTFYSGNKRQDNLLILGCNCMKRYTDVNLYVNGEKENVLAILALRNDGIHAVDLQQVGNFGIGVNEPVILRKNLMFKLGNLAYLAVQNVRSSRRPFIKVQITGSEEPVIFNDIDRKYYAGKTASDLRCIVSGVSNEHCCIYYDKNISKWMLEDKDSTNGTWLLLKDYNEYMNSQRSNVINCGASNVVLALDSLRFIVTRSE